MKYPFSCPRKGGAYAITDEQAAALFTAGQIEAREVRGDPTTVGPWGIVKSYRAIATCQSFEGEGADRYVHPLIIYGVRTMSGVAQYGYELEGNVSLQGTKYRALTSSALFELPDGRLINAAIIHICLPV